MSLGFISAKNKPQRQAPPAMRAGIEMANEPERHRTSVKKNAISPGRNWLLALLALNALLFATHLVATILAASATISFPVTVFETRINECVRTQFQCLYTTGSASLPQATTYNNAQCSDPFKYAAHDCLNATAFDSTCPDDTWTVGSSEIFVDSTNTPILDVYELATVSLSGDASQDGKAATRGILVAIEAVTAIFHLLYAFIWARLLWWDSSGRLMDRLLLTGGLPARWYEYAITASLMSFFISNSANVFDINALLAIALGTFALMFVGATIELLLYQGRPYSALVLLYIPGAALFLAAWLPSLRQAFGDVARLSCVDDGVVNVFTCKKSCFGAEVPIVLFVFVLLLLFAVFPLIALTKIYYVGGWEARWTRPTFRLLDRLCCIRALPLMWVFYGPLRVLLHLLCFLIFAVWGVVLAISTVVKDSLWPFGTAFIDERAVPATDDIKWRALVRGEFMYAIASVTSKLFLFIFFMASFARRDW